MYLPIPNLKREIIEASLERNAKYNEKDYSKSMKERRDYIQNKDVKWVKGQTKKCISPWALFLPLCGSSLGRQALQKSV